MYPDLAWHVKLFAQPQLMTGQLITGSVAPTEGAVKCFLHIIHPSVQVTFCDFFEGMTTETSFHSFSNYIYCVLPYLRVKTWKRLFLCPLDL